MRKTNSKENVRADDPVCPRNKGITLIALVITIIVLLILAIVSINLVMNGGIIGHAETAVKKYETAQTDEQDKISEVEKYMGEITGDNDSEILWAFMDFGDGGSGIVLNKDVTELDLSQDKEIKAYVAIEIDGDTSKIEYTENMETITVKYSEVNELAIWGSVESLILGEVAQGKITKIDNMGVKNLTVLGSFGDIPTRFCSEENVLETIVVGEGVKNIARTAFYSCEALKSLSLPSTLTSIGPSAFYNCTNLTNITIKQAEGSLDLSNSGLTEAQINSVVWAPETE